MAVGCVLGLFFSQEILADLSQNSPLNSSSNSPSNTLTLAYANQWAPYSYANSEGDAEGILVDIADHLLSKKLGLSLQHIPLPWERAQKSVSNGRYDALITAARPERLFYMARAQSVLYSLKWQAFISLKSPLADQLMVLDNPLTLQDIRCIVVLGDRTSEALYRQYNIPFLKVKNLTDALNMLKAGRVDLFVHSRAIMKTVLDQPPYQYQDTIAMHNKILKMVPFTLLINKQSHHVQQLIPKLDKLVGVMRGNGEYSQLLHRLEQKKRSSE